LLVLTAALAILIVARPAFLFGAPTLPVVALLLPLSFLVFLLTLLRSPLPFP